MKKKRIYIASPLGFSETGREFYYNRIIPAVEKAGFEVIDPWKLIPEEILKDVEKMPDGAEKKHMWQEISMMIGRGNTIGLISADGVLAILDGKEIDSGTAAEIGYASALEKPIVGYRNDYRQCGDNEGTVINLQVEFFIRDSGGTIVHNIEDIAKALQEIFNFIE